VNTQTEQTVTTYDYYWRPVIVARNVTITDIRPDNARTYGTYTDPDGVDFTVWQDSNGAWQLGSRKVGDELERRRANRARLLEGDAHQ